MLNIILTFAFIFFVNFSSTYAAPPASSPELIAKGKKTYEVNCLMCHGANGDGKGPAGAMMKPPPRNFMTDVFKGADGKGKIAKPTPQQVFDVIKFGVKGTSMPSYAHISDDEKWGMVYYLLNMRK